jgi:hypothetical protein
MGVAGSWQGSDKGVNTEHRGTPTRVLTELCGERLSWSADVSFIAAESSRSSVSWLPITSAVLNRQCSLMGRRGKPASCPRPGRVFTVHCAC